VRLGIGSVRGIGDALAREIEAGRPYRDMEDLARRVPALTRTQLEALATAGAFVECVGAGRRDALWAAGAVAQSRPDRLHGVATGTRAPVLPGMAPLEEAIADLWATGIAPDGHPTQFFRERLRALGVCTADELGGLGDGVRVVVAGVVTHRQRPPTAGGVTFVNVEDETGHVNVIVSRGCWRRHERAASASSILVRGRLRCADGAINLEAERIDALGVPARIASRDYH
jgi:error-prone DNA polymerase